MGMFTRHNDGCRAIYICGMWMKDHACPQCQSELRTEQAVLAGTLVVTVVFVAIAAVAAVVSIFL
jgi:hypothetical protein